MKYKKIGDIQYHLKGVAPRLIIHSGTHGDESRVIAPLEKVVGAMYSDLPNFLYVPRVSPSAVVLGTRQNKFGNDLNRVFSLPTDDPEVVANKQILALATHSVAVSFHEDLEHNQFYMYDSGTIEPGLLNWYQTALKKLQVPLYTGVDDPHDVHLAKSFVDGYLGEVYSARPIGTFVDDWILYHSHASRVLTIEMPGNHAKLEEIVELTLKLATELVDQEESLAIFDENFPMLKELT